MSDDKVFIWRTKSIIYNNQTITTIDIEYSAKGRDGLLIFGTSSTNSTSNGNYFISSLDGTFLHPNNSNVFENSSITVDTQLFSELKLLTVKVKMLLSDMNDYVIFGFNQDKSPISYLPNDFTDYKILKVNLLEDTPTCTVFEPAIVEALDIGVSIPILIFYVFLFFLCLAFGNQQPLKSRGFTPYMILLAFYSVVTSQLFFFGTTVEWRNYYFCYVSLILDNASLQISNFLMFFNFLRFVFITYLNNKKESLFSEKDQTSNDLMLLDRNESINSGGGGGGGDIGGSIGIGSSGSIVDNRIEGFINEKKKFNLNSIFGIILRILNFTTSSFISVIFIILCLFTFYLIILLAAIPSYLTNQGKCTIIQRSISVPILVAFGLFALILTILTQIIDLILNFEQLKNPYKFFFINDPFYFRLESLSVTLLLIFIIFTNIITSFVTWRWLTILLNSISLYWVVFIQCFFVLSITIFKSISKWFNCLNKYSNTCSVDMHTCLTNSYLKSHFKTFCKQEWSIENLLLWQKIEKYKIISNYKKRKELSEEIFNTFLDSGSFLEVNITRSIANSFKYSIDNDTLNDDSLQNVQLTIETNLSDTYSRFIHTKEFIQFEKKMNKKKNEQRQKSLAETALSTRE
eukprot:gene12003-5403_t